MQHAKKIITSSFLPAFLFTSFCLLPSCTSHTSKHKTTKLTAKEHALVNNPSQKTMTEINAVLPIALQWYAKVEESLYDKGRSLSKAEKKQALSLRVKNPEMIRVVILEKFPEPNNQTVNNHLESARAMGNIIMIKPQHKNNSVILCHELVHIAQVDRLGLKQFLTQLAIENRILGYSRSMLENEAYALQQVIK